MYIRAPMREATSESCADAFIHHWYSYHGMPSRMTNDNGTTFTAGYWTGIQKELGCEVEYTPYYHPQSLGSVERQHREIKVGLRARLLDSGGEWFDHLPHVMLGRATGLQERFGT